MIRNFLDYEGPVVNIDVERIPRYRGTTIRRTAWEFFCPRYHAMQYSEWRVEYMLDANIRPVSLQAFELSGLEEWGAWKVQIWMGQCPMCGTVYQTWECIWMPREYNLYEVKGRTWI